MMLDTAAKRSKKNVTFHRRLRRLNGHSKSLSRSFMFIISLYVIVEVLQTHFFL